MKTIPNFVGIFVDLLGFSTTIPAVAKNHPRPRLKRNQWKGIPGLWLLLVTLFLLPDTRSAVLFQTTSPYHQIQVSDQNGVRMLSYNGIVMSQMSLKNHSLGHFAYIDFFQLPWLWTPLTNVAMVGLGAGSAQRAYQRLFPNVTVETIEIDETVVKVAKQYFGVKESTNHVIRISDGRTFLGANPNLYQAILIDVHAPGRASSLLPYHLATKEFFELARDRLSAQGVLAYNVTGTVLTWRADVVGSVFRTLRSVFPQVYIFPAPDSLNVVLIGTKTPQFFNLAQLQQKGRQLIQQRIVSWPYFMDRIGALYLPPPAHFQTSTLLTDSNGPPDGVLRGAWDY